MKDILDEPQYENKALVPASAMDRFVSTLIDICLFFLVTYFVNELFVGYPYWYLIFENWYILLPLVLFYMIFFPSSDMQATLGMQLLKIRLIGEDKQDVGASTVVKRTIINLLVFFGFVLLTGPQKQSPADKLCKTLVIKS